MNKEEIKSREETISILEQLLVIKMNELEEGMAIKTIAEKNRVTRPTVYRIKMDLYNIEET